MENLFSIEEVLGFKIGHSYMIWSGDIDEILSPQIWRGEDKGYLKRGDVIGVTVRRHYVNGDVGIVNHATYLDKRLDKDVTNYVKAFGFDCIAARNWLWMCQQNRWKFQEVASE